MTEKRHLSSRIYVSRLVTKINNVPYDMMRYDRLVPATEEDAHKLERIANNSDTLEDHQVVFLRYALNPGEPTLDRWRGFGMRLISWEPK